MDEGVVGDCFRPGGGGYMMNGLCNNEGFGSDLVRTLRRRR